MSRNFQCTEDFPVVQTKSGKVRGYQMDDLFYFRGIPYAKAERFMMPEPVEPWDGVRNARVYGYVCPPMCKDLAPSDVDITTAYRFWPDSEDCLNLNVWTPSIDSGAKKPVMVYCHGGAYSWGSCLQLGSYEADNLSKKGDVVVVNFNHRLNALGFLNLASFGEKYKYSASAGIADMVAVLDWVQDNIANFGGDPDNVTIFGQSGGGGKVLSLMQTSAADGKYHRAIIQSGFTAKGSTTTPEESDAMAKAIVAELGLTAETIDRIQTLPRRDIENAFYKVAPSVTKKNIGSFFCSVANGYFKGFPLDVGFSDYAKKIPVIIGSCFAEWALSMRFDIGAATPEDEKMALVNELYGAHAGEMIDAFHAVYPGRDLVDLYLMNSEARAANLDFLDERAKLEGAAPTYSYVVDHIFNYYGGYPAWHNTDLPLIFGSTDLIPVFHDDETKALSDQVLMAWASFAKNGDPNHANLPQWDPYTLGNEATMVLKRPCEERVAYDRDLIALHQRVLTMSVRDASAVTRQGT